RVFEDKISKYNHSKVLPECQRYTEPRQNNPKQPCFKENSSSGNNNNGVPSGSPTLTADRFGNANSAYEFGGIGDVDYFTVANHPTLQFTNQLSISYWFKQCSFEGMNGWGQTVANGFHTILGKAGDGFSVNPGFWNMFNVDPITNQLQWSFNNQNGIQGSSIPNFYSNSTLNCINLCEWTHVVIVVNITNIKVYFNGNLALNETIPTADFTVANNMPLYIGKMDGTWYPYRGTIDDIKIYNCAINETTIATLNGGFTDPNNTNVTPTFASIGPICSGSNFTLPTTSQNGISGTWSPAINTTQTTSYVFTPNANQCANTTTLTVQVATSQVTPIFTQVAPICSGGVLNALPINSNNGITGTWSPALINSATTTYTFTPNVGQCATTQTMTIVVNPNITPTFTQVAPICSGG
ncbi:MAG: LamG domain-containing protein, partial [Dolichospermum sp.]